MNIDRPTENIYRIRWRLKNTGALIIDGVGNASNFSRATDPAFVAELTGMFPDFEFVAQHYSRILRAWVDE